MKKIVDSIYYQLFTIIILSAFISLFILSFTFDNYEDSLTVFGILITAMLFIEPLITFKIKTFKNMNKLEVL